MSKSTLAYQLVANLNNFDGNYLSVFLSDATVSDPASHEQATGHAAIASYFQKHFFDFQVQTNIHGTDVTEDVIVVAVTLKGNFTDDFAPTGEMSATFTIKTILNKISELTITLN